jgi:DNA polymerase
MLVGEQPGNQEDLQGAPFVGPAGNILNKALEEAGIARDEVYVTNAVKHFKFEERGKRRLHKKPTVLEIAACRPWLLAEIALVKPRIIVAMGATAALALAGKELKITRDRGRLFPYPGADGLVATVHPSSLLRIPEKDRRHEEYARFVNDLRVIKTYIS